MKLIATAAIACLIAAPAVAGDVVVTLNGVEARGGDILAALNGPDTFLRGEGEYGVRTSGDVSGAITLTFEDVAPGDYALAVMHDENGDGQMNMSPWACRTRASPSPTAPPCRACPPSRCTRSPWARTGRP